MSSTSFAHRMARVHRAAQIDRRRQTRVRLLAALALTLAASVAAPVTLFLASGDELGGVFPKSSPALVGCNWVDNLNGGFVQARSRAEGAAVDQMWSLADGEAVQVVNDPGPAWNPAREVTVITSGAEDTARVRRWSLRPGRRPGPAPVRGASQPARRDPDPLTPNPDRDSQRQHDVLLRLR